MERTTIQRRIDEYLAKHNISAAELSRAAGLGDEGLRNILRGTSQSPRIDTVRAIARAMGITIAELIGEQVETTAPNEYRVAIDGVEYVRIPAFDLAMPMTDAAEPVNTFLFRRDWLAGQNMDPDDCLCLIQRGRAMENAAGGGIRDGDTVLFARTAGGKVSDGIYWIRIDGDDLIRRLAREPGGTLTIACDNPAMPTLNGVALEEIEILGRAKWHGQQVL